MYFTAGTPDACAVGARRRDDLAGTGGLLRVGILVASELPRDRSTLLVRLMAAGPGLPGAIADLAALPDDALEHAAAAEILLRLRHALSSSPQTTAEEQEFIVSTRSFVKELKDEGRQEGSLSHARATLRRILAVRKLTPTRRDEARIDGCDDLATLDRWIEQALTAATSADALRVDAGDAGTPPSARRRKTARVS